MNTKSFEQAIEALGVRDLEIIRFCYEKPTAKKPLVTISGKPAKPLGTVAAVYARQGELTWLKWDAQGRGFRFDQPSHEECCISSGAVEYLDYRRDKDYDLTF